ncbi:MAG: methyltransferase domain-containing protein [Chlorobi bacterium]|nr:methyltransferase domain-containing protein [Chlorobiota bacterium]
MPMTGYYEKNLSGRRLQHCYEIAPPRVRQYLDAEIEHVISRLRPSDTVLELGCGYGRVALRLAETARHVVGIDTSLESIALARELAGDDSRCRFRVMDALDLCYQDASFDAVVCVQNGICAFGVDREALLREALRVARPGGRVLFSTYSDRFWPHRLEWFEAQAEAGLVGEIDHSLSGNGVIVCEDGFRVGRMSREDWKNLCARVGVEPGITEVDGSSVFCEIAMRKEERIDHESAGRS